MTRDERKRFQQKLAQQGRGYGLLIYDAGTPVAWCQFGPADGFPRYDRGRAYGKLALEADEVPQWRASHVYLLTNTDVVRLGEIRAAFSNGEHSQARRRDC